MAIKVQTLKGFRDFLPEESLLRNQIINKIKTIFEKYGFLPLETPALEYQETLLGKYGEEADKLIYTFKDRGGREIGLRYDQTVPLARIIAQYPNIIKPFKRYQIQPVWRAENPQKGRYREFLQCDIDIVGSNSLYYDGEIICCALETIKKLGFKKGKMLINDRKLFKGLKPTIITTIDKLSKIGKDRVIEELIKKGYSKEEATNLLQNFEKAKPNETIINLFSILNKFGLKENQDFVFSPTLARGLDYYTSTIFELVSDEYPNGSLGGGGRYDNLIGKFTKKESIPAVGFAFGFDRIIEAIKKLNLIEIKKTSTKILVTIFNQELIDKSIQIVNQLRNQNINTEILFDVPKLDKQLKYADKRGIPYVIILGPDEIKKNTVIIKNMKSGDQKEIENSKIINFLKEKKE